MKITKRQLRRIIKEAVPHERQAFLEDHPDFQRGYNDASAGRRRMPGATPEYASGYEEGLEDAYYDGSDYGYIKEEKQKLLNEIDYDSPMAIAREHVFKAAQALAGVSGAERAEMKEIDILIDRLLEAFNKRL